MVLEVIEDDLTILEGLEVREMDLVEDSLIRMEAEVEVELIIVNLNVNCVLDLDARF